MDGKRTHGGSWLKPPPPNFTEVFIADGWRGIEAEFGARTAVNKRWVRECGGDDLKRLRQEGMRVRRQQMRRVKKPSNPVRQPTTISDQAQRAVAFLRSPEGGSWRISAAGPGEFYFGCAKISEADLIGRARRRGWACGG